MIRFYQLILLCSLCILVLSMPHDHDHHVHNEDNEGQPYPERPNEGVALYAEYLKMEIPNYSILRFSDFSDDEVVPDSNAVIEGIWCQSGYSENDIGIWYSPNHTSIPIYTESFGHDKMCAEHTKEEMVTHPEKNCYPGDDPPIFSASFPGQTALLKDRDSETSLTEYDEGLYYCTIANETLVVGLYLTNSNVNTGPIATDIRVSIMDSEHGDNEAVLSFNVSNGPPTSISCTGPNGLVINETSDQITRTMIDRDTTSVSIVLRQLELLQGTIKCNISNKRVWEGSMINGIVASEAITAVTINSEGSLNVSRLGGGLALYEVSWTGSHSLYHLYYTIPELNISITVLGSISNNSFIANLSHILTNNAIEFETGSSYHVQFYVMGSSDIGDGTIVSIYSIESTIAPHEHPSVTNVSSTLDTISIQLTWSIEPSNGYTVVTNCWMLCDSNHSNTTQQSSNATTHVPNTITDLAPGMACSVSIHGHYGDDDVIFTSSETFQTAYAAPSLPPMDVEIVSVYSDSVIIQWGVVPCYGQNGPIQGYYIQYSPIPDTPTTIRRSTVNGYHTTITVSTNVSMATLTDLSPYTNYSIFVTPFNSAGNGTKPYRVLIQTNESVPGLVFGIVISSQNDTSILVSWNEPMMKNGQIISYDVHLNHSKDNKTYSHKITTSDMMVEITGLPLHSMKYTISIRAYTAIGPGEWVNMDYIKLTEIRDVQQNRSMNDSTLLLLTWSPVTDNSILRLVVQFTLFPRDQIYEIKLSKDSTSVILPLLGQLYYSNITIFGVYLIDGEVYEGIGTVVDYEYDISSQTSCITVSVNGRDEGLDKSHTDDSSGTFIAIIVVLCIALLIAILIIVALSVILRRKLKQAKQEITTERMNSFEFKRKLSSKDDTYVEMSASDTVSPQYENVPHPVSITTSGTKSTDEYCDGGDQETVNTDSTAASTPDDQEDHKGQEFSQSGVYESIL